MSPSAADSARVAEWIAQGKAVSQLYTENPFARRPEAVLPHGLPPTGGGAAFGVPLIARRDANIPSIKELLKKEMGPLGYRYKSNLSGQGCYTLRKQSADNYIISLSADASPIAGQFCSSLHVRTLYQSFSVRVQLPPHGADYPINEHIDKVIANTAFVVRVLEATYVRDLAGIFGPAPAWFATWGTSA